MYRPSGLNARTSGWLGLLLGGMLGGAAPASGQAAPPPEAPDTAVAVAERTVPETPALSALEERWAAPFAVERLGRPPARPPRRVVVLRDSAAARRVAEAQVAVGESSAEVKVEAEAGSRQGSAAAGGVAASAQGAAAATEKAPATGARATPSPTPPVSRTAATTASGRGAAAPSPAADRPRTHRVEYGETWYGILREYRVSSARLAAANPDVDPERLRAGTVLRIPAAGDDAPAPRTHTVVRGDTLYGIARRYGVTPAAIRTANHMTQDVVRLGQTLVIPPEEASR